ncbi:MAG: DNA-binding domain-containing protein, partial [Betaproteobacteria bacterium]|nr:DNA-binding domain-containing protein [Betaproteobacteria bacterium]
MNLRQLQAAFAMGLRRPDTAPPSDGAPDFDERFDAYRNNAWQFFAAALEQTYPVVQRRVGNEFFRQLAREYRAVHPSRRGDLHWVGVAFPAWL